MTASLHNRSLESFVLRIFTISIMLLLSLFAYSGEAVKIRIIVFNLDRNSSEVSKDESVSLSDYLRNAFINVGYFEVISRDQLNKIMSESKFQASGLTSASNAIELGKLLNVKNAVVGTIGKFGETYLINIQLVDMETGKYITAESIRANSKNEVIEQINSKVYLFTSRLVTNITDQHLKQLSGSSSGTAGSFWSNATTNAVFPVRHAFSTVVFNNKMWVIGGWRFNGAGNDVWYSADGTNWIYATASAAFPARCAHTAVVYKDKMWVIGGWSGSAKNDVWYSGDGVNWTCATANAAFPPRYYHSSVVFNNKMWVIGGWNGEIYPEKNGSYLNDVWYSGDGTNWSCATANGGFPVRHAHTTVVFNNNMWIAGGVSSSGVYNDVWYSSDGAGWTCAITNAAYPQKFSQTTVVFNNKMWLIGGWSVNSISSEVWYSADGTNWICSTAGGAFHPRSHHTSAVFNNAMWVIGGLFYNGTNGNIQYNDVWYTQ